MTGANPFLDFMTRYADDPVAFVQEVLGQEPDEAQAQVMRAVAAGKRRIAARSGHGVGKSTLAAWTGLWYMLTRFPVKVVITAPTKAQLFDALWAELETWANALPKDVRALIEVKTDRIELLAAPSEAFIAARTSRAETPEAMAGVHSANVLLIGDEASGIPEAVFEAAAGSMSGESATTLLLGNPVRGQGYFYDVFHKLKASWTTFHISCRTCSRVAPEWIAEMEARYGINSNAFRVRVEGEFPTADDDTVIPYDLVASAQGRDVENAPDTPTLWGLDVARFGTDASCLVKRRGRLILEPPRIWRGYDLMQLCGLVAADYESLPEIRRPREILVDSIGLGAGAFDRLREMGLPARGINVSESPALKQSYHNLRAELWYKARAWFEGRDVSLPTPGGDMGPLQREALEQLVSDLTSVKYLFASTTGKIQIESKKDMRKRSGRSPDAADALVLTFASSAASALRGRDAGAGSWHRPIMRNLKGIV